MDVQDRANSIVERLKNRDVNPIKVDVGTKHSDPAIWITESIYIQVGDEYVIVFRSRPTGLASYESSGDIEDIMSKLKQAIEEGKE